MYSDRLVMKLNDIAQRYKSMLQRSISEILSDSRYRNTGAGAASVTVEVIDGDNNKSPQLIINFADHMLFLDKRKLQWTQLPNMKNLIEWAETKKSNPIEAKKLAFAVAYDKKKNDTWKAKPWRKKSLSNVLKEMNVLILQSFEQAIDEDNQEGINRALAR